MYVWKYPTLSKQSLSISVQFDILNSPDSPALPPNAGSSWYAPIFKLHTCWPDQSGARSFGIGSATPSLTRSAATWNVSRYFKPASLTASSNACKFSRANLGEWQSSQTDAQRSLFSFQIGAPRSAMDIPILVYTVPNLCTLWWPPLMWQYWQVGPT